MTRQPHDQFAKQYLEELLSTLGKVETSRDVRSEVQSIDVWFVPSLSSSATSSSHLGLLSQMTATSCLFEPYRNAPTEIEIRSCLLKLYTVHGELLRKAKREKQSLVDRELPFLWILSPSCSVRIKEGFGAEVNEETWVEGIYFLSSFLKTAIVAINQLPITSDTLWLRVLGKGGTQKQAIEELVNLPERHPFRDNLLEILANWRKSLELRQDLSIEEKELIMNLSPAYIQQRETWKLEGKEEGQSLLIASLLERRFGILDEELQSLIPQIVQLPSSELSQLLLNESESLPSGINS